MNRKYLDEQRTLNYVGGPTKSPEDFCRVNRNFQDKLDAVKKGDNMEVRKKEEVVKNYKSSVEGEAAPILDKINQQLDGFPAPCIHVDLAEYMGISYAVQEYIVAKCKSAGWRDAKIETGDQREPCFKIMLK